MVAADYSTLLNLATRPEEVTLSRPPTTKEETDVVDYFKIIAAIEATVNNPRLCYSSKQFPAGYCAHDSFNRGRSFQPDQTVRVPRRDEQGTFSYEVFTVFQLVYGKQPDWDGLLEEMTKTRMLILPTSDYKRFQAVAACYHYVTSNQERALSVYRTLVRYKCFKRPGELWMELGRRAADVLHCKLGAGDAMKEYLDLIVAQRFKPQQASRYYDTLDSCPIIGVPDQQPERGPEGSTGVDAALYELKNDLAQFLDPVFDLLKDADEFKDTAYEYATTGAQVPQEYARFFTAITERLQVRASSFKLWFTLKDAG